MVELTPRTVPEAARGLALSRSSPSRKQLPLLPNDTSDAPRGKIGVGPLAELQRALGIDGGEEMHDAGHDSGPARLVAGAEAGAVVAVEVLVEQDAVAPVRVLQELPRA